MPHMVHWFVNEFPYKPTPNRRNEHAPHLAPLLHYNKILTYYDFKNTYK